MFPTLWIAALISLAARWCWNEPLSELIPAFLRTVLLSPKGPYMDGVVWTLVVEAVFYLVVAVAVAASARGIGTRAGLRRVAIVLGFASTAFNFANWWLSAVKHSVSDAGVLGSFAFDLLLLRQRLVLRHRNAATSFSRRTTPALHARGAGDSRSPA